MIKKYKIFWLRWELDRLSYEHGLGYIDYDLYSIDFNIVQKELIELEKK